MDIAFIDSELTIENIFDELLRNGLWFQQIPLTSLDKRTISQMMDVHVITSAFIW